MAVLHSPGILDITSKLGFWSCITELLPDLLSMEHISFNNDLFHQGQLKSLFQKVSTWILFIKPTLDI